MKFDDLIAEMIEICKSRLRRQNFAKFPRLVYVSDQENYGDEQIRGRLGDGGKALLKSANVVLIVNNELAIATTTTMMNFRTMNDDDEDRLIMMKDDENENEIQEHEQIEA